MHITFTNVWECFHYSHWDVDFCICVYVVEFSWRCILMHNLIIPLEILIGVVETKSQNAKKMKKINRYWSIKNFRKKYLCNSNRQSMSFCILIKICFTSSDQSYNIWAIAVIMTTWLLSGFMALLANSIMILFNNGWN